MYVRPFESDIIKAYSPMITPPVVNPYNPAYRPYQPTVWNAGYPAAGTYYAVRPVAYPYQAGYRGSHRENQNQNTTSYYPSLSADQFSWSQHPDVYNQLSSAGRTYFVDRFPIMMQALPSMTEAARTLTMNLARFFL